MGKYMKIKTQNGLDKKERDLPIDLSEIIKRRQRDILTVSNGGLIRFFWETGMYLNKCFDENKESASNNSVIKNLSTFLSPKYGHYFGQKNITDMASFASQFPDFNTLGFLVPFVSWEHILLIIPIKDIEAKLFYLELAAKEGLSVNGLREKIFSNLIEENRLPKNNKPSILKYHKRGKKINIPDWFKGKYASINIFKEPTLSYIQPILTLFKRKKVSINEDEKAFFEDEIYRVIDKFRLFENSWINENMNLCFWEIGQRINQKTLVNSKKGQDRKTIIRNAADQMSKKYGSIFNEKQLRQMSGFAEAFPDLKLALRLAKLLSWKHIQVLLPLEEIKAKLFYARLTATKGLSVIQLKSQIAQNVYVHTIGAEELEQSLIDSLANPKITTDLKKGINNTVSIITTISIDFKDSLDSNLVVTNILKNSLVAFLESYKSAKI